MSRCIICDASSGGLSYYRPDGKHSATRFHRVGEDEYCQECYDQHRDVEYDFDLEDTLDEESSEAFDYDE